MRTLLLLALCCLALRLPATAQFNYSVKASTGTYTPLTNASSLTGGKLWGSDTTLVLPLGFNFTINGVTTQKLFLSGCFIYPARSAKRSGFAFLGTGLTDRGQLQGSSKSAIRYNVSGAAGSRIFKLEMLNAGFEDEMDMYGELKDSANLQVWLYEGSNAVEYRFGSADITNFSDYFGSRLLTGYLRNMDTLMGTFEKFHLLDGAANAPTVDSITVLTNSKGLQTYPVAGTIYRFTPKGVSTGVKQVAAGTLAGVFPTRCQSSIHIRNTSGITLQVAIYGMDGRLLIQSEAGPGDTGIDMSALPAGQYLIHLVDETNAQTETGRIEKL